jgi:DNA-binding transcriptional LysR family regulator
MKLAFLATLDAVLKRGSFAKAGGDVGLTPSAVSLQIKQLEEFFGQPLFDRSSRTAQPTPFAREVVSTAQAALGSIERLRVKRGTDAIAGRVPLGTIRSVQVTTLPQALRVVQERYPLLEVRLTQNDSPPLLRELNAGTIDAAVVVRPASGGSTRLAWYDLATEVFVLLAPPTSTSTSPAQLFQGYDWIRFDTALTSGRIARSFVHKVAPRARGSIELRSIEAIVAMVSAGLGISVVPRPHAPLRVAFPVREISLGPNAPRRQIAFACRSADRDNRLLQALRECFEVAYDSIRPAKGHARPPGARKGV